MSWLTETFRWFPTPHYGNYFGTYNHNKCGKPPIDELDLNAQIHDEDLCSGRLTPQEADKNFAERIRTCSAPDNTYGAVCLWLAKAVFR